jgi:hypothetical protein
MKKTFIFLFLCLFLYSCSTASNVGGTIFGKRPEFVPNMPDVPLPKFFLPDSTTSSFFDSAEGRIAEVNAEGFLEPSVVDNFYSSNMGKYGWTKIDNRAYKKGNNLLLITITKGINLTYVNYQLRPLLGSGF